MSACHNRPAQCRWCAAPGQQTSAEGVGETVNDIIVYRDGDGKILVSVDGGETGFEPQPWDSAGACTAVELPFGAPSATEVWRSGPDA